MGTLKRYSKGIVVLLSLLVFVFLFAYSNRNLENEYLLLVFNTLFLGIVPVTVSVIAARTYVQKGIGRALLMSCGMLVLGIGSTVAGIARFLPDSANYTLTTHNLSAFLGSIFNLLAATMETPYRPQNLSRSRKVKLGLTISGICVFVLFVVIGAINGIIPKFFNQQGSTEIRNIIIWVTIAFYFGASIAFSKQCTQKNTAYLYWYSLSLLLIALGLFAVCVEKVVGSPLCWVGRSCQYIGCLFAFLSMIDVQKQAKVKGVPTSEIMADFFMAAESNYKDLVEHMSHAVILVNEDFRIFFSNTAARKLFQYEEPEMQNLLFLDSMISETDREQLRRNVETFIATGQSQTEGKVLQMEGIDKGGRVFPIELTLSVSRFSAESVTTFVIQDVSERMAAKSRVDHQNLILQLINRIYEEAYRCNTVEELGRAYLGIVQQATGSRMSFFNEVVPGGLSHTIAMSSQPWGNGDIPGTVGSIHGPLDFKIRGLFARILINGESVMTGAPSSHPDSVGVPNGHPELTAFLGVPMLHDGKVVGMVGVANREGGYRREDQELLEALAPTIIEVLLRKRAEVQLVEAKAQAESQAKLLQTVIDNSVMGIVVIDANGNTLIMNPAALKPHKLRTLDEYKGYIDFPGKYEITDIDGNPIPPEEYARTRALQGETFTDYLMCNCRKDVGVNFIGSYSAHAINDENGNMLMTVITMMDITDQKKAELERENAAEAQRQSERLLRTIIEGTDDVVFLKDRECRIIIANEPTARATGVSAAEMLGRTDSEFYKNQEYGRIINENDRRIMKADKAEVLEEKVPRGEEIRTYLSTKTPWHDEHGNVIGIIGIARDITESKKMEEALRTSEERLRVAVMHSNIVLSQFDRDLKYIWIQNPHPDFEASQMVGKRSKELEDTNATQQLDALKRRVVETGMGVHEEITFQRSDGAHTYDMVIEPIVDGAGAVVGGTSCGFDITERMKLEAELKNQNKLLESIIENMLDAFFVIDKDGKYIKINKVGRALFPAAEMNRFGEPYQTSVFTDFDGNPVSIEEMPYNIIKRTKDKIYNEQLKFIHTGSVNYYSFNGTPVFDDSGEMEYAVITARDVVETMQSQQKIREHQETVLQAEIEKNNVLQQTINMKDEFLLTITHEFKTPLSVINSALQTMELVCKKDLTKKIQKYHTMIKQNSNRQLRLVNNLLDVTRMDAGRLRTEKKSVDIVAQTKSIVDSIAVFTEQKGLELSFASTVQSGTIGMDAEKYERILLNLLSNAVKFTPAGQSIAVDLSEETAGESARVCIQVRDTGVGIPEDKLDYIFEKFGQVGSTRTKQAEGTGIGLHLVKLLVELLGGEIKLDSTVGVGSTFTVLLPADKADGPADDRTDKTTMKNRLVQATALEFSDVYFK